MSKLRVEGGEIKAVDEWKSEVMNVKFVRRAINPQGDLGRIEILVGSTKVEITYAQGVSLANEILKRCQQS